MRYWSALFAALLCVGTAHAQLQAQGTPTTFDVATWNIEWFGSDSFGPNNDTAQRNNVRSIIEQSEIDLFAVQEIADPDDFDLLLQELGPGYDGRIATNSDAQRIGFIFKTDVVGIRSIRHVLEQFDFEFAGRPPLQLEANVTVADTTVIMTFIVVHMKAFGDADSHARRVDASNRMKVHMDFGTFPSKNIVFLGDYNDLITGSISSGRTSPYANFRDDPNYFIPTKAPEDAGLNSYCNNDDCNSGSFIDHILITDDLVPHYVGGSADHYNEVLTAGFGIYPRTTSDHLPIFARFDLKNLNTASEAAPALPTATPTLTAYPNPFAARTTLRYTLPHAAPVRLDAYDLLGRHVATLTEGLQPAGEHTTTFDAAVLPLGPYFLRLTAGAHLTTRMVTRGQ